MLDIRNAALAMQERHCAPEPQAGVASAIAPTQADLSEERSPGPVISPINLSSGRPRISLQDMIAISVALKSELNVDISTPTSPWPLSLFPTTTALPATGGAASSPQASSMPYADGVPSHVVEAIAGLQREVLLLRNELNFELWLSREHVKHIGRLYQDRILSKGAEAERQGLVRCVRVMLAT